MTPVDVPVMKLDTFRDRSTIIVCPTLGMIPTTVVSCWLAMTPPLNSGRAFVFTENGEVGDAYERAVAQILTGSWGDFNYLMTVEADNMLPRNAHIDLVKAMESGDWDVMAALYYSKGTPSEPMVFGHPNGADPTNLDLTRDFQRFDVTEAEKAGAVVEVNGVPMGCTLFKMDLFRELDPPWFVTVADKGIVQTQDLYFSNRLRKAGKKLGVHCGVRVGHLDVKTREVY